ncbi:MAG: SGNH/GDSL hydrolase family protein [Lautropia sp.]
MLPAGPLAVLPGGLLGVLLAAALGWAAMGVPAAAAAQTEARQDESRQDEPRQDEPRQDEANPGDADPCPMPEWAVLPAQPLPALARALAVPGAPVTIVVLGPLQSGGRSSVATGAVNYPARLQALLGDAWPGRPVRVEAIGKPRGNVHEQLSLIDRQVLPLRPALVVWQVGRADARGAVPSNRFGQALLKGISKLKHAAKPAGAIDTLLMTMQFHPNSEALYRTDEYRNAIAWVGRASDTPVVDRFTLIEHWWNSGIVDFDSQDPAVQRAGVDTIQRCIATRLASAIVDGAAVASPAAPAAPAGAQPRATPPPAPDRVR